MKHRQPKILFFLLIFIAVLSACTPPAAVSPTPGATPSQQGSQATPLPQTDNTATPESTGGAQSVAAQALAEKLGLELDQVKVVSVEAVDWNDSCLGLGGPAESCLQAITPGYRVTLEAGGKRYEVRTDAQGAQVRVVMDTAAQTPGAPVGQDLPAGIAAATALAEQLGVAVDQVKVVSVEAVDWTDSCLGLGGPAESCLMAITPGYRVMVEVNGQSYEVRTDAQGTQARVASGQLNVEPGGEVGQGHPAAVAAAVALADYLKTTVDQVKVISMEPVEWTDGCLGLAGPEEVCTLALVSGYRIMLEVNGSSYEVRTDGEGRQVRVNTLKRPGGMMQPGQDENVLVSWQREGGIAGFCDELVIAGEGIARATSCKGNRATELGSFQLTTEQYARLSDWVQRFASFEYLQSDGAVADSMSVRVVFTGQGTETPSKEDQQQIATFMADVFAQGTQQ